MKTTGTPHDQACLAFAHDLYGHEIQFDLRDGAGDAYTFHVGVDRALHVKAGSARGVLYAVYDALAGKRSGDERPEFVIRGLNPCESLNRHTPEQLVRFMDRMGRWRMNTLIIHSNYGFRTHQALIEREAAKRGIELVHYTYSNLCFMDGIAPEHFAKDSERRAMWAVDYPYTPTVFERAYLDPDDGDFFGRLPGHPKWDRWRGNYPRAELAKRLYHFNRLTDVAAPPGSGAGGNPEKIIVCCREILDYIINHPQREDLDWIYMGHPTFEWVPPYLVVVG